MHPLERYLTNLRDIRFREQCFGLGFGFMPHILLRQ
jgi:hypothetical protein